MAAPSRSAASAFRWPAAGEALPLSEDQYAREAPEWYCTNSREEPTDLIGMRSMRFDGHREEGKHRINGGYTEQGALPRAAYQRSHGGSDRPAKRDAYRVEHGREPHVPFVVAMVSLETAAYERDDCQQQREDGEIHRYQRCTVDGPSPPSGLGQRLL